MKEKKMLPEDTVRDSAPGTVQVREYPAESDDDEYDERPRLSCSGSGRVARAFTLRQLKDILQR